MDKAKGPKKAAKTKPKVAKPVDEDGFEDESFGDVEGMEKIVENTTCIEDLGMV